MRSNRSLIALVAASVATLAAQPPRLELIWRVPAGTGVSAVTASDTDIYVVESNGDADQLVSLDAATGSARWRATLGTTHAEATLGPRGRPAVAGPVAIAVGSSCHVVAVRRDTGAAVWDIDLAARFKSRFAPRQPCAQSVLVDSGRAIFVTGAPDVDRVVAVDATTGALSWTAEGIARTMMTTPVLQSAGTAIVHTVNEKGISGLTALDTTSGRVRWQTDAARGLSEETPLPVSDTRTLLQSWSDSRLLETGASAGSGREVWTSAELTANGTPPVLLGATIFGFGGNHGDSLLAIDASTGVVHWRERVLRGSVAPHGDRLVVLSETSGFVRLVRPASGGYDEEARLAVLTPGAPAPGPAAIAGDVIYVRSTEEVAAVRVRSRSQAHHARRANSTPTMTP